MLTQMRVGELEVEVELKAIKNVHLSVHPPTGRVRIAAPDHMKLETIRAYAASRMGWIKRHQGGFQGQEREAPREYVERESHYVWGRRYLLHVEERDGPPSVRLTPRWMILSIRQGAGLDSRAAIVARWYRGLVQADALPVVDRLAPVLGVEVDRVFVRAMRTKWGSCNPDARSIRLNTELGKSRGSVWSMWSCTRWRTC
jgi:predicted metal-dependent hydrolase